MTRPVSLNNDTATTPAVITANPGTPRVPPFPLNHARILYENVLFGYSAVTDSPSTGTGVNALTPNTWERWQFTGNRTITITLPVAQSVDTVCLGAHNLAGATIQISINGTPQPSFVQQNNFPIFLHLSSAVAATSVSIAVTATGSRYVGYISAGVALQMQRPFFNGHTPITDADVTEYYSNRTESGEIIGQQIRRKGYETQANWNNIDDEWYRTYFAPFKQAAKLRPFFFAWNLLEYPQDIGFVRIAQDVSAPMQNGTRTKRTISMTLLGAG